MKNKNKTIKTMKRSILLMLFVTLFAQVGIAQTTVTVGPGMSWVGYMNTFDSTGVNYITGSGWAVPDLKTVVDAGNGSMQLKPNYNTYNATDPYWSNGAIGNKVLEANTYIEDLALLGQNLTFEGFVDSFTINSGYIVTAFIKVLDANNGYQTVLFDYDTIRGVGTFSANVNIPNTAGFIPQYGFSVRGLNANPVNEAAYGKVLIRGNNAPPLPPINVTFQVQNPDSLPVHVFGSWSGWSNFPGDVMTSIGNNTYEATIQLNTGDTVEYQFVSGTAAEVLNAADPCTNGNTSFTNRKTIFGGADTTICAIWNTCSSCVPVGIDEISKDNLSILVSNKFITLNATSLSQVDGVEIYDMVGKTVFSSNGKVLTNQQIAVDLQSETLYLIRVNNGNQYHTVKTIILQ